jgi:hypothetical protein
MSTIRKHQRRLDGPTSSGSHQIGPQKTANNTPQGFFMAFTPDCGVNMLRKLDLWPVPGPFLDRFPAIHHVSFASRSTGPIFYIYKYA